MTRQEKINAEFQRNIDKSNMRVDTIEVKIDAFIRSLEDFKAEMRNKDNQRAAEMSEIRASLQNIQLSGRNLNIVTLIGIAAMVVAILLK